MKKWLCLNLRVSQLKELTKKLQAQISQSNNNHLYIKFNIFSCLFKMENVLKHQM
ncbi:unnamed protein product [Paramecium sonneborni]|uniref:Uncharacterized protein n=1 Tax=Paramecium sonneborni TaxID=65129 RepID=A0A8S1RP97_9CILI|nr:unnamed protein product [Paramecium sonneborni]